jgi:ubiquinone/menaquinone biosynthesis C-methylase UbiE
MSYLDHKEHFNIAYKTGTDSWSHQPTENQGSKLIEKLSPGAFILDIGSGRGFFAKHLAGLGFRVIGLDFEKEIVEKANKDIKDWGLEGKLKFMEADALSIPLTDNSFDAVCDFGLLETLYKDDWPKYANEINRVLKPGGFYLNVSLSRETQSFFEFLPKKEAEGDFEKYGIHYHFFEKEEMKNIFRNTLEVVSQEVKPAQKEKGVALLETLFQKFK